MRRLTTALVIGVIVLFSAACGSSGSAGSPAAGSTPTLKITSPDNSATVSTPFTVTFVSSAPIGPTDSGKDHVHVFIDAQTDYRVVTSTRTQVNGLSPGRHTIRLSLRHADHSAAGAEAQVTVVVAGGSGGTPSGAPSTGGYGY